MVGVGIIVALWNFLIWSSAASRPLAICARTGRLPPLGGRISWIIAILAPSPGWRTRLIKCLIQADMRQIVHQFDIRLPVEPVVEFPVGFLVQDDEPYVIFTQQRTCILNVV